jgi:hypothetical protein
MKRVYVTEMRDVFSMDNRVASEPVSDFPTRIWQILVAFPESFLEVIVER